MPVEHKTVSLADAQIEVKADLDAAVRVIGYGSVFGNVDSYQDIVLPGAYSDTIRDWSARGYSMPMLWNHDPIHGLIGKWTRLEEDTRGLLLEGELAPTTLGNDVATLLKAGAASGMSIGFRTVDAVQDNAGNRLLKKIALYETSLVTMPANDLARVGSVKSADGIETLRDFETLLRELGWSRREAEAIAIRGFKTFLTSRDEPERNDDGAAEKHASLANDQRRDGEGAQAANLLLAKLREWRLPTSI